MIKTYAIFGMVLALIFFAWLAYSRGIEIDRLSDELKAANENLKEAKKDFKDLATERNRALQRLNDARKREEEIRNATKPEDDGPVAPVLLHSLERMRNSKGN